MSSERDDLLFDLEQRLAQVGKRLSAGEASFLIAEDLLNSVLPAKFGQK
jgi:hypothetical protein